MNRNAVVLALALLVTGLASAQSTSETTASKQNDTTTAAQPSNESPLVKAAREAAAKRDAGSKSRRAITDKDVKSSTGKLIETTSKPLTPIRTAEDVEARMRAERATEDAKKQGPVIAAKAIETAEKRVAGLEAELRRIEETYYDEDDPDFREDVIEKRFEETKTKLEKAREELEAARAKTESKGPTTP
ncbi:MAG: hypothetical protein HYU52_08475 [Acidobacteria bacterium]|nr:hypothetical protein [Acidobacteriota bacterium]